MATLQNPGSDKISAEARSLGATDEPIVVPGNPGAVSIQAVDAHPVVYEGAPTPAQPATQDSVEAAFQKLFHPSVDTVPIYSPQHPGNVSDEHLADLRARQDQADANDATMQATHAELDAMPPPSNAPVPVPTVEQQPQRPQVVEAGIIPDAAIGDIGRGLVEAPDMAMSGAKAAVRNLLVLSDHLTDMVTEHLPEALTQLDHGEQLTSQFDKEFPDTPNDKPHSVTGGLIKGVSQFGTGMAGGASILKGWKVAAGAGQMVKAMAEGAISDFGAFDGHQERLSGMLAKHAPGAVKPLFDYLAGDPRDSELEGRFKNALEGLGLGGLANGVMASARMLRAARVTQRAAQIAARAEKLQGTIDAPHTAVVAEAKEFATDLQDAVGDPAAKGFTVKRKGTFPLTAKEVVAHADSGERGANTIGLNYAKITDAEDMQAAAVQLYDAFHGEITGAKRGVQKIAKQVRAAFGVDVEKMLADWKPGTAMLSHELTAMRFAQAAAFADYLKLARHIDAGDASPATQAAWLQVGFVADALTRAVEGGKAEAGRTLQALSQTIPSMHLQPHIDPSKVVDFYRQVDALIAGGGGPDMVKQAVRGFLTVAANNPQGTSKFLRSASWYGKITNGTKEVIRVFATNGLLTATGITANVMGNAGALVWERALREVAPKLAEVVGAPSYIASQEHIASQVGALSAFQDVFRLADHLAAGWNPITHGKVLAMNFDAAKLATKGFTGAHREEVVRSRFSDGLERGPEQDTALGRVASVVWGAAKSFVTFPGKTHGVLDDFSNIISGRAELHSQAFRQAVKDAETGLITAQQIGARTLKYAEDPTKDMLDSVVKAAQETSWTRKPDTTQAGITNAIKGLRDFGDALPVPLPLGTAIAPFVNTPANLFSYGLRNSALAPLSSRWRADFNSADGAVRQLAMTRWALGSMFSMYVMNHVANGTITAGGPHDPVERQTMMRQDPVTHETMFKPYSIVTADGKFIEMSHLEPVMTPLALAADFGQAWLRQDWSDGHAETAVEKFSSMVMSIGGDFLNKSTMQGVSQMMDAMADTERGGVSKAASFVEKRAVAMIPFSADLRAARQVVDPYRREARSVVESMMDITPGLSQTLPPSLDLWGRKRSYDSDMGTVYDHVIPAKVSPIGGEPIDREMVRLGFGKSMPDKTLRAPGSRDAANLRNYPSIYNQVLLRGGPQALKELNDLVSGADPNSDYYAGLADGSDPHAPGSKARWIQGVIERHMGLAKQSVARDFADDLAGIAAQQRGAKEAARGGQ